MNNLTEFWLDKKELKKLIDSNDTNDYIQVSILKKENKIYIDGKEIEDKTSYMENLNSE